MRTWRRCFKILASWELGEVLGEGGYSVVKLATNKETNQKAAVKIVRRVGISKEDEESLLEEVRILKSINHPNITSVFDFFEEKKHFYVVMELLEGGELFDRIVKKSFYNEKILGYEIYLNKAIEVNDKLTLLIKYERESKERKDFIYESGSIFEK